MHTHWTHITLNSQHPFAARISGYSKEKNGNIREYSPIFLDILGNIRLISGISFGNILQFSGNLSLKAIVHPRVSLGVFQERRSSLVANEHFGRRWSSTYPFPDHGAD